MKGFFILCWLMITAFAFAQDPVTMYVHIHGSNDHTLPIRNVKAGHVIESRSHMMTLTRGEKINALIQSILAGQKQ